MTPEAEYCDLLTGVHIIPGEYQVGMMQYSAHPEICPDWPLLVSRRVWEAYRSYCERTGQERFNGPFQANTRSLPTHMGGTGRFSDSVGEYLKRCEEAHKEKK